MALYCEVWARPGAPTFGRVIDFIPNPYQTFHDGLNIVGDGVLQVPSSFDRFDEILLIDEATPANCVSSLVRIFDDSDPDNPIFEWLPSAILPTTDKFDPNVDISGEGIKSIMKYARVEAYDWDGSLDFECRECDWVYGGPNKLGNPGFEDQNADPTIYWLVIDATAGTFTLSDGTDTTSALAYNISDGVLESEIESDIAAIDDILATPLGEVPVGYQLLITATTGTFTISSPADTTGALSFGISAAALTTAIEGLSDVTDVTVTAITVDGDNGFQIDLVTPSTIDLSIDTTNLDDGSAVMTVSNAGEGFELEFVTPPTGITLTVNDAGITGSATLVLVNEGVLLPTPWTKSQQISFGTPRIYGVYDTFAPTELVRHTGLWSLEIDPGAVNSRIEAFAGAQQVISVQDGALHQASIWVWPTAAGQTYRLVLRGIDEDLIARVDVSPPANTWTQVSLADVMIPDGDTRIIFRFANTNLSGNPATFYIDDAVLQQGQAATTVGAIIGDLYADAVSEHAGRIVWEDEANPGNPYLTLDFTDSVDSNGDPWAHPEIEVKLWMRMTYLQVLDQFVQTYGYEWRVVPNNVETGTWYLQLYNAGGMQTDYTLAASPGIQTGSRDTRRSIRRFIPAGTQYLVEGTNRVTARDEQFDLTTALGRIETSRISRQLPSLFAAADAAYEDKIDALINGLTYTYELTDPIEVPLADYLIGDALHIEDPPEVSDNARLIDVECVVSPNATEFEVQFSPQSAAGS